MFNNVGEKIKGFAKTFYTLQIVFYVLLIVSGAVASFFQIIIAGIPMIVVGIIGCALAKIPCYFIYGYGELIENSAGFSNGKNNVVKSKADEKKMTSEKEKAKKTAKRPLTEEELNKQLDDNSKQSFANFKKEIKEMDLDELLLILNDQKELYSEQEIAEIEKELAARSK